MGGGKFEKVISRVRIQIPFYGVKQRETQTKISDFQKFLRRFEFEWVVSKYGKWRRKGFLVILSNPGLRLEFLAAAGGRRSAGIS
jgi:hypothetical protein